MVRQFAAEPNSKGCDTSAAVSRSPLSIPMQTTLSCLSTCLLLLVTAPLSRAASTLVSGSATMYLDAAAWATVAGGVNSPGFEALILDEFFNQAAANARTGTQILNDEVEASPSYSSLILGLNGPSVSNLSGRATQATTFSYDPLSPTTHTGVIGLGGVTRWDVNPLLGGGNLVFGDFTLKYDANRLLVGGTGWVLTNNVFPAGAAFDLFNIVLNATSTSFSISGDMGVSYEVANFLFATPSDQGKDVGNFSFTATATPEPSRALLMMAGIAGAGLRRRRRC